MVKYYVIHDDTLYNEIKEALNKWNKEYANDCILLEQEEIDYPSIESLRNNTGNLIKESIIACYGSIEAAPKDRLKILEDLGLKISD
jgi:hypothetical protein